MKVSYAQRASAFFVIASVHAVAGETSAVTATGNEKNEGGLRKFITRSLENGVSNNVVFR